METQNNRSYDRRGNYFSIRRIIAAIFGIIELILAFRLILKLLGANTQNILVQGLYDITQPVVGLFEGIFVTINSNIVGIQGAFEPATIIAIIIISLINWVLFKLISRRTAGRLADSGFGANHV
jgi:uncharacterized membrane protein YvlD (DUF360 family)